MLLLLTLCLLQPLIIAVKENETVLSDTPTKLGIEAVSSSSQELGFILFVFFIVFYYCRVQGYDMINVSN